MGRKRIGDQLSVVATIRVPGEQVEILTEDHGNLREAIRDLITQRCTNPSAVVCKAVKKGALVRPDHCSECGKRCKPHGHHDDYSKLLEVRWLCVQCHAKWHRENEPIRVDGLQHRVVVLVEDADLRELKRRAGLVPLSTWIRNVVLGKANDENGNHQNVSRTRAVRVVQQRVDPAPPVARVGACHHGKQKGELCYKCDPHFGNPVIGETAAKPR